MQSSLQLARLCSSILGFAPHFGSGQERESGFQIQDEAEVRDQQEADKSYYSTVLALPYHAGSEKIVSDSKAVRGVTMPVCQRMKELSASNIDTIICYQRNGNGNV